MAQEIIQALQQASRLYGVHSLNADTDQELCIRGAAIDYYLLVATLAMRLEAGDVELVEKGDSIHKRAYQEKLIAGIKGRAISH